MQIAGDGGFANRRPEGIRRNGPLLQILLHDRVGRLRHGLF